MIRLNCDYLEGCHPSILKKLTDTNLEQTPGYGTDHYCKEAADAIRNAFSCRESAVHFLVGGTQANMTVIAAALRPYEGVLCAQTGHINVHETGAIESTGHKCLALPHKDGLISASQVAVAAATQADDEHTVRPGMVYISMSTELGTVYNRSQLKDLYYTCKQLGLYLFIDGARLGYALAAPGSDITPADIAKFSDVFTVGGTKMGALFGEAVVINNPELNVRFRYMIKQKGGMLAKGRLLGLQFLALMEDDLYFKTGRKAVEQAMRIRAALLEAGFTLQVDAPTNQLFPVFTDAQWEQLEDAGFVLEFSSRLDEEHVVLRVCTSWCTPEEYVDQFIAAIKAL
ncbi:MAG: aminotransferase class I/II-fold pyridoxal phosphate-dependent enzyme [Clostridiales bacterium]|nr:aminotransferase class I/II-fold pyridoxal phosphate-dependent enzyme [Clostridiales bacterium]